MGGFRKIGSLIYMSRKRTFQLLAAILAILTMVTGTYAAVWVTRTISMSGGLVVSGSIQIYSDVGMTQIMTSFDYPLFSGAAPQTESIAVYIKNTGSVEVYVYWSADSFWVPRAAQDIYEATINSDIFRHMLIHPILNNINPQDGTAAENFTIPFGGSQDVLLNLNWNSGPGQGTSFNWVTTISAEDA